jgi:hypothetical protein
VPKVASSRSFGLLFVAVFLVIAAFNYWADGHWYPFWAGCAVLLLAVSLLVPRVLAPLKRQWLRLGALLHHVVGPLVLSLVYVLAIVPVGLLVRVFGKDPLSLRRDPTAASYWIRREGGGLRPDSLRDQF